MRSTYRATLAGETVAILSAEESGPPTFSGVAYSGSPVAPHSLKGLKLDAPYVIDLAGLKLAPRINMNLDHKRDQSVGQVDSHDNNGSRITVTGSLSAATAHRDEVADAAACGFQWELSIEAEFTVRPRKIPAGKTETINGQKISGPLYVFPKGLLTNIAFVGRGADRDTSVTI